MGKSEGKGPTRSKTQNIYLLLLRILFSRSYALAS